MTRESQPRGKPVVSVENDSQPGLFLEVRVHRLDIASCHTDAFGLPSDEDGQLGDPLAGHLEEELVLLHADGVVAHCFGRG